MCCIKEQEGNYMKKRLQLHLLAVLSALLILPAMDHPASATVLPDNPGSPIPPATTVTYPYNLEEPLDDTITNRTSVMQDARAAALVAYPGYYVKNLQFTFTLFGQIDGAIVTLAKQ
jgi:hypothetical protein